MKKCLVITIIIGNATPRGNGLQSEGNVNQDTYYSYNMEGVILSRSMHLLGQWGSKCCFLFLLCSNSLNAKFLPLQSIQPWHCDKRSPIPLGPSKPDAQCIRWGGESFVWGNTSQWCLMRHHFPHSSTGGLSVALVWCLMRFSTWDCMLPGVKWMHSIWNDRHIFPCCLCLIFLENLFPTPETSCQWNIPLTETVSLFSPFSYPSNVSSFGLSHYTIVFQRQQMPVLCFSKAAVHTIHAVHHLIMTCKILWSFFDHPFSLGHLSNNK